MKVEIRDNSVHIEGYVNAVERDSKVLMDYDGRFIEKIKAGAFQRALERDGQVPVWLNHDPEHVLANPSQAQVYEDAIGLRAVFDTDDELVVEKARSGKLSGWSFGFRCLREDRTKPETADGIAHRYVRELELKEVSLLDDTKTPAYIATSVEVRDDEKAEENIDEIRAIDDVVEIVKAAPVEEPEIQDDSYKFENRYYETYIH